MLQEIDDAFDVKGDYGFLAFYGFQEGKVLGVVVEEILREDSRCIGVLEQVKRCLKVGISVGVVSTDALAGKMFLGCVIKAGGQFVGKRVALAGVGAPAAGFHPLGTVSGCVGVDADDDGALDGVTRAAGQSVGAANSLLQRNVLFLGCEDFDIVATEAKVLGYGVDNDAVELVLPEPSVWGAFAGGVDSVTGIENNGVHVIRIVEFE